MGAYIQVFVSSTFSDFSTERQHMARTLPAALRSRFRGRNVDVSLLDLRWGVTEEQLRDVGIVSACMAAVERCTPFFVGLIGDNYGTVPLIRTEDFERHPWLLGLQGKSITELEIIHGVLNANNPRAIFVDRTTGLKDADPRVQNLLATVEASGAPTLKNPATVDTTLAFIEEHLARNLEAILPDDGDDPLAVLTELHGTVFFGRDQDAGALAELLDGSARIVWVTGGEGAGKSAMLTDACARARTFKQERLAAASFSDEADDGVIEEALAGTCTALGQMNEQGAPPAIQARDFFARLNKAAVVAAGQSRKVCVVWDNAPAEWISRHAQAFQSLPQNVRLIATSQAPAPNGLVDAATFVVPPPGVAEIDAYITGRLERLGRRIPSGVRQHFVDSPQTRNYHFATIALDELLQVSSHVTLARDAADLTSTDDLASLIEKIVHSIDIHFGGALASSALGAAYYYEKPIPDTLLQDVLEIGNLKFASLRLALSGPFAITYGGLILRSSYRAALAQSRLLREQSEAQSRTWLASRLLTVQPPRRIAAMVQYHRVRLADKVVTTFEGFVTAPHVDYDIVNAAPCLRWANTLGVEVEPTFVRLHAALTARGESALSDVLLVAVLCDRVLPGSKIASAFHEMAGALGGAAIRAASKHNQAVNALAKRNWRQATDLSIEALITAVRHRDNSVIPYILSTLSAAASSAGAPRTAECFIVGALDILGQMDGRDPSLEAALLSNLGRVYKDTDRLDEAIKTAQRCVDLRRASGETERLPLGLSNLGSVQLAAGLIEEAHSSFVEAWDRSEQLKLASRANIATSLVVTQARLKRKIKSILGPLEASIQSDASLPLSDVVWFYLTCADRFAEEHDRVAALAYVHSARSLLSSVPSAEDLQAEVDYRFQFLSDRRSWSWTGTFRGWPKQPIKQEAVERIWSAFPSTEEYARFLFRNSLVAVASNTGDAMLVIAKDIKDLPRGPVTGIDWKALETGIGPPPREHDVVALYSAGSRYLAFWIPIIPINPLYIAVFNAAIAATAYADAATEEGLYGEIRTAADFWIDVLRDLLKARQTEVADMVPATALLDGVDDPSTSSARGRAVCTYFPRLKDFRIAERLAHESLVFSWLADTISAQSMDYPVVLWIEHAETPPIMFSKTGEALGAPVLVVALERSSALDRFSREAFLGVFTPDGHQTRGMATPEGFRSRSWETARKFFAEDL
jgi:tetratricopeptide (TPR) repeat protein